MKSAQKIASDVRYTLASGALIAALVMMACYRTTPQYSGSCWDCTSITASAPPMVQSFIGSSIEPVPAPSDDCTCMSQTMMQSESSADRDSRNQTTESSSTIRIYP